MTGAEMRITEADLVAYADGRIEPGRLDVVEAWLTEHPDDRQKVEAWRNQTQALRAALDPVTAEPVPTALTGALSPPAKDARRRAAWTGPALAASLALAVGLGAGWYLGQSGLATTGVGEDRADVIAYEGYRAHKLYTREVRHPVEVDASEEKHLVTWLSKRIEAPLRAPNLAGEGLELLGGRLIPVDGEPAAQLMYETATGDRYTLFAARADGAQPMALHFEDWGEIGCIYWIDGDIGYALNGPNDRDRLMTIATKVYEQLS
jgi:anti-sigma factor RsiW